MLSWLWLIPALPFASATLLILFGSRLSREKRCRRGRRIHRTFGAGYCAGRGQLPNLASRRHSYTQVLWTWINVAGFQPQIGFISTRCRS